MKDPEGDKTDPTGRLMLGGQWEMLHHIFPVSHLSEDIGFNGEETNISKVTFSRNIRTNDDISSHTNVPYFVFGT